MNIELIIARLKDGEKAARIAHDLSLPVGLVRGVARNEQIQLRRGRPRKPVYSVFEKTRYTIPARAIAMRDEYLAGMTLEEIGAKRDITRERVRQIIYQWFGCLSDIGGISVQARERHAAIKAASDAKYMAKHGMTRSEFYAKPRKLRNAFLQKVSNLKAVGVPVSVKFIDWFELWEADGRFDEYGRGKLGVERIDESKPFSPGNICVRKNEGQHLVKYNAQRVAEGRPHPAWAGHVPTSKVKRGRPAKAISLGCASVGIDVSGYASVKEASLALRGRATAQQIAQACGCSRNAVIGYWFRARNAGQIGGAA